MKILRLLLLLVLLPAAPLLAQNYKTGVGFRGGYVYGLTVKHFVDSKSAVEGIISPRWDGVLITGLYEKHTTAFQVEQLQFYGGIGAHVGFWDYHDHDHRHHPWFDHDHDDHDHHRVIGADLVLGLEYTFRDIPFAVGVDWKPALNLVGHHGLWYDDVAFNLRFLLSNL
ncbi:hypothetical protein POKO110462_16390 [Pontibacter korlensis]|uniref:Outer membrane protein beta-barrel domain-containing protein n=1 Tax=Pontibacter korlensis TaxID=400092 RepID=A0A0E3ZJN7_9BACT|nr:hypothetical protein [Pontibacter korlensis]AKD05769.1 hypothetical protein PKOR_16230 [Pontibacter korlensis]